MCGDTDFDLEYRKLWTGLNQISKVLSHRDLPVHVPEICDRNQYHTLLDLYYQALNNLSVQIKELINSGQLTGEKRNQTVLDLIAHSEQLRGLAHYHLPREYYKEVVEVASELQRFTEGICDHVMVRDWLTFQIDKTPKECKFCRGT